MTYLNKMLFALTVTITPIAEARPGYLSDFLDHHGALGAPTDQLREFRCGVCHINPRGRGPLTPYGIAVSEVIGEDSSIDFAALYFTDSDQDGNVNLGEILSGKNPGDVESNTICSVPEEDTVEL